MARRRQTPTPPQPGLADSPGARSYREAGVDLAAADESLAAIKESVRRTFNAQVVSGFGGFGGAIRLPAGMRQPVIVSSIDSVGTKVSVAARAGRLDTVGHDIVHHCVNDILVTGARPLCFLDYVAFADFNTVQSARVVLGVAAACTALGVPLVGGETAQLPGVYGTGEFDLVGAVVGVAEEDELLDVANVRAGDVVVALLSNGIHTNGYSLVRRVFEDVALDHVYPDLGRPLGDELLAPHRCYLNDLSDFLPRIHALAHITGGGLLDNIPRSLPDGVRADLDWGRWQVPAIFELIAELGDVPEDEMARIFNLGIGMAVFCDQATADDLTRSAGASIVGTIQADDSGERVRIRR